MVVRIYLDADRRVTVYPEQGGLTQHRRGVRGSWFLADDEEWPDLPEALVYVGQACEEAAEDVWLPA